MSTAFSKIAGALADLLKAVPGVSAQVDRARLRPVPSTKADAVVVRLRGGPGERFAVLNGPVDWDTEIDIECYARSTTVTADEAVDAVLAKVYARIASNPSLDGLVMDLLPTAIDFDFATAAEELSCATLTIKVMHRTQNLTLE